MNDDLKIPTPDELTCDPTASRWLKESWATMCERDPADAANDAEYLYWLCEARFKSSIDNRSANKSGNGQ